MVQWLRCCLANTRTRVWDPLGPFFLYYVFLNIFVLLFCFFANGLKLSDQPRLFFLTPCLLNNTKPASFYLFIFWLHKNLFGPNTKLFYSQTTHFLFKPPFILYFIFLFCFISFHHYYYFYLIKIQKYFFKYLD